MYTFKRVKSSEVDEFAIQNGIFRQTSTWAKMKKRFFKPLSFIGKDEQGKTVFSCLFLRFNIPLTPFSICYAPRGFVCDYKNKNVIEEFTSFYKKYMKKHFILYSIFDPEIVIKKDFKENQEGFESHHLLTSLGYKYNEGDNPHRHFQNNNNYRLLINYDDDNVSEKTLKSFEKKLQYDINLCEKRGVTIEKYSGEEYVNDSSIFDKFYDLIIETSKRKGFEEKLLPKEKYQKIIYALKDYGYIYLAKYNYEIDKHNTDNLIAKAEEDISRLIEQNTHKAKGKIKELKENIESYQKRLLDIKQHQDNPYIATSFFLITGNQTHYMFGGNSSELRFAKPTSFMVWEMINDTIKKKAKIFNTGGSLAFDSSNIKEDSMYSVYEFKSGLNGELVDFAGDYYLINSSKLFNLLEKKFKLLKRLNSKY